MMITDYIHTEKNGSKRAGSFLALHEIGCYSRFNVDHWFCGNTNSISFELAHIYRVQWFTRCFHILFLRFEAKGIHKELK